MTIVILSYYVSPTFSIPFHPPPPGLVLIGGESRLRPHAAPLNSSAIPHVINGKMFSPPDHPIFGWEEPCWSASGEYVDDAGCEWIIDPSKNVPKDALSQPSFPLPVAFVLNLRTCVWSRVSDPVSPLPAISRHSACLVGTSIIVYGGLGCHDVAAAHLSGITPSMSVPIGLSAMSQASSSPRLGLRAAVREVRMLCVKSLTWQQLWHSEELHPSSSEPVAWVGSSIAAVGTSAIIVFGGVRPVESLEHLTATAKPSARPRMTPAASTNDLSSLSPATHLRPYIYSAATTADDVSSMAGSESAAGLESAMQDLGLGIRMINGDVVVGSTPQPQSNFIFGPTIDRSTPAPTRPPSPSYHPGPMTARLPRVSESFPDNSTRRRRSLSGLIDSGELVRTVGFSPLEIEDITSAHMTQRDVTSSEAMSEATASRPDTPDTFLPRSSSTLRVTRNSQTFVPVRDTEPVTLRAISPQNTLRATQSLHAALSDLARPMSGDSAAGSSHQFSNPSPPYSPSHSNLSSARTTTNASNASNASRSHSRRNSRNTEPTQHFGPRTVRGTCYCWALRKANFVII